MKKLLSRVVMLCFFISIFSSADGQVNPSKPSEACIRAYKNREYLSEVVGNLRQALGFVNNLTCTEFTGDNLTFSKCEECKRNCRGSVLLDINLFFSHILDSWVSSIKDKDTLCRGVPEDAIVAAAYKNRNIKITCSSLNGIPLERIDLSIDSPIAKCARREILFSKETEKVESEINVLKKSRNNACTIYYAISGAANRTGCNCLRSLIEEDPKKSCNKYNRLLGKSEQNLRIICDEREKNCIVMAYYFKDGNFTYTVEAADPGEVNNLGNDVFVLKILVGIITLYSVVISIIGFIHFCL